MKKIITDKQKIDELLEKGVEKIYPSKDEFRKRLLKGERIRLYCGYDPTASSLHIGNAITINKLAQFQALGHEVIFLVGSFTATIGDPTDKASARKKMTREEVDENSKLYKEQASAYLDFGGDNPAQVMNNSTWNDKLSFKDLIELSAHFTVQQMIQRDMFQKRLQEEKPIYLHEFLYPLAQAYELATKKTMAEVKEIKKKLGEGVNPRDMKMKLAFEIVSIVHGEKRAREAEEYFVRIVQKKEIPEEIAEKKLKIKNWKLVDLLAEMEIEITKEGVLLQKGKRGFVRVVLK